jgi:hypothetical protein
MYNTSSPFSQLSLMFVRRFHSSSTALMTMLWMHAKLSHSMKILQQQSNRVARVTNTATWGCDMSVLHAWVTQFAVRAMGV